MQDLSDAQQEVIRDIKPTPALEPVDDFVAAMEAADLQGRPVPRQVQRGQELVI